MKKKFAYGLSAFLVASVMLMQVPAQAVTKTNDTKTTTPVQTTKSTVKTTKNKPMTGGAAGIMDKKTTETKSTVKTTTTKPMPTTKPMTKKY